MQKIHISLFLTILYWRKLSGPDVIIFFMFNSTEHELSISHRTCNVEVFIFLSALKLADVVFILLINVKMPTIVGIFT